MAVQRIKTMEKELNIQSTVPIKIAKRGCILLSVILCALGVVKIAMPQFSTERFNWLCGAAFIALGCIRLIGFYSKDLYRLAFQYDFEFGILIMILGLLILIRPEKFVGLTCVSMGTLVLVDALFKVRIIRDARRFGIERWWLLLIIAIVTAILGGVLIFYFGGQLDILFGITLIAEGVLGLSTALVLVKIIQHQVKE